MGDLGSADFRNEAARSHPQYAGIVYALMCIAETQAELVAVAKSLDAQLEKLTSILDDWRREVT